MRPNLSLTRFYRRGRRVILGSTIIVILLALLYGTDFLFTVKQIQIEGAPESIQLVGLSSLPGKNLIFLNIADIEKKLKTNNPQIKEIAATKIFPQTLKLTISLYKPEAVVVGSGVYFYLSEDGRVLFKSKKQELSLPIIYYYQKFNDYAYQVGEWIAYKDLNIALHIAKILADLGMLVEKVDIGGSDMIVFKIGKKEIFFTSQKDEEVAKYELTQIVKQFKIEGREFKSLDLRFEKPIIKF